MPRKAYYLEVEGHVVFDSDDIFDCLEKAKHIKEDTNLYRGCDTTLLAFTRHRAIGKNRNAALYSTKDKF